MTKKAEPTIDNFHDLLDYAPPERCVNFGDAYLFRAEDCKIKDREGNDCWAWITGVPIYTKELDGATGEFTMVALQLTQPTVALDREKKLVRAKKGETIILTATAKLAIVEKLARVPSDKGLVVSMRPLGKVQIGAGKDKRTMWDWEIRVDPVPVPKPRIDFQLGMGDESTALSLAS